MPSASSRFRDRGHPHRDGLPRGDDRRVRLPDRADVPRDVPARLSRASTRRDPGCRAHRDNAFSRLRSRQLRSCRSTTSFSRSRIVRAAATIRVADASPGQGGVHRPTHAPAQPRGLGDRDRRAVGRTRPGAATVTVVALDATTSKLINDTQGHLAGDEHLISCADRWRELAPDQCRTGQTDVVLIPSERSAVGVSSPTDIALGR